MRKYVILGIAVVLGGAALLIPAGAQSAISNNQLFDGSVTDPINVSCDDGAETGSASYTVSVASTTSTQDTGSTGTGGANEIRVFRDGNLVATLTDIPDSEDVTETSFPCPGEEGGEATFTFRSYKSSNNTATGTADTVTVDTNPTSDGS